MLSVLPSARVDGSSDLAPEIGQFRLAALRHSQQLAQYRYWARNTSALDRRHLFESTLASVTSGAMHPESLLVFVITEENHNLVFDSVRAYLRHRHCDVADEMLGLREIARLVVARATRDPGAVLAAIVSMSDSRALSVARSLRRHMSAGDIKAYSRIHDGKLREAAVAFALEWMLELDAAGEHQSMRDIGCGLLVEINQDESGQIEIVGSQAPLAFKQWGAPLADKVLPIFRKFHHIVETLRDRSPDRRLVARIERAIAV